jgi:hypothetical protein
VIGPLPQHNIAVGLVVSDDGLPHENEKMSGCISTVAVPLWPLPHAPCAKMSLTTYSILSRIQPCAVAHVSHHAAKVSNVSDVRVQQSRWQQSMASSTTHSIADEGFRLG